MCSNLKQLDGAKKLYALDEGKQTDDFTSMADLIPDYVKTTPSCPSGGTYEIGNIGTTPTCAISGHEL